MHREPRAWGHLLSRLTPDIALLQETTPREEAYAAGAVIAAPLRPTAGHGSAIFVRGGRAHALEVAEVHRGWFVAAEVHLGGAPPLVAVSVHGRTVGLPGERVRPNIDRGFDALEPILRGRSFIVGGDLNLSRNYKTSDAEFLDALPARGVRRLHAQVPRRGAAHELWATCEEDLPERPPVRERRLGRLRTELRCGGSRWYQRSCAPEHASRTAAVASALRP
jgi:hypothetical protein